MEFLTTIRQIKKHLKSGMKILDLGAGAGEYSIFFAKQGFDVTAIELVEKHVNQIREKIDDEMSIKVFQGNALELSIIEDKSYEQWLSYHFYCCEKPEFLGASNHLLFVAEK